jgi:Phosphoesterase family
VGVACDGSPTQLVTVIDSGGNRSQISPCFDFPTLADRLESGGIPWRYYGGKPNVFSMIRAIRNGPAWQENFAPETQFISDAEAGHLPAVSWLPPPGHVDSTLLRIRAQGKIGLSRILNAIMRTQLEFDSRLYNLGRFRRTV